MLSNIVSVLLVATTALACKSGPTLMKPKVLPGIPKQIQGTWHQPVDYFGGYSGEQGGFPCDDDILFQRGIGKKGNITMRQMTDGSDKKYLDVITQYGIKLEIHQLDFQNGNHFDDGTDLEVVMVRDKTMSNDPGDTVFYKRGAVQDRTRRRYECAPDDFYHYILPGHQQDWLDWLSKPEHRVSDVYCVFVNTHPYTGDQSMAFAIYGDTGKHALLEFKPRFPGLLAPCCAKNYTNIHHIKATGPIARPLPARPLPSNNENTLR